MSLTRLGVRCLVRFGSLDFTNSLSNHIGVDLTNVIEVFLPQLLTYPNPTDPLNPEAASLMMRDPEGYKRRVQDYVKRYASEDAAMNAKINADEEDSDSDISSVSSFSDGEVATMEL